MTKQEEYFWIRELKEEFASLTRNFDLDDWRTARTPYYWESDKMPLILALQHKIKLLEYYINKGVPLK